MIALPLLVSAPLVASNYRQPQNYSEVVVETVEIIDGDDDVGSGHENVATDEGEDVATEWVNRTPQPRNQAVFRKQILNDHNRVRANVSVSSLVWDDGLEAEAADYAATLARTRTFAHSKRVSGQPVEGENLWMGTFRAFSYGDMIDGWANEGRDFKRGSFPNLSRTGSWHDVGHYTQMVWAGTRSVGCAIAHNQTDEYMVCRYFPAGNVWGQDPLTASSPGETFPHHNVLIASQR